MHLLTGYNDKNKRWAERGTRSADPLSDLFSSRSCPGSSDALTLHETRMEERLTYLLQELTDTGKRWDEWTLPIRRRSFVTSSSARLRASSSVAA